MKVEGVIEHSRLIYQRRQWHPTPVLLPGKSHGWRSLEGCSPWGRWLSDFTFTFHFHALEKEMATHSSVLAWRIPGMGEPGGLLSMGSHRVGHDWSDLAAAAATCRYVTRSWIYPSLVFKLFMFYWGIQDRYKPALRDVVKCWGTSGFIWEDWRHISPQRIHSWIHK